MTAPGFQLDKDPLRNNVMAAVITMLYVHVVIKSMAALVNARLMPPYFSRKVVHIAASCWICFWPLFDDEHITWTLNATVPVVMSIQLFYKGAVKNDAQDPDVVSMSRSGNPNELLQGPLQFTIVMSYIGLKYFMLPEAIYMMAALGFGDGFSAIIGPMFGSKWFNNIFGVTKSAEGTGACILATYAGIYIFSKVTGVLEFDDHTARVISGIAGVVEAHSPNNWDNYSVPLSVGLYFWYQEYKKTFDEEDEEDYD